MVAPQRYDWVAIRKQYLDGASYHKLARVTGAAKSTIQERSKKEGWPEEREALDNSRRRAGRDAEVYARNRNDHHTLP